MALRGVAPAAEVRIGLVSGRLSILILIISIDSLTGADAERRPQARGTLPLVFTVERQEEQ